MLTTQKIFDYFHLNKGVFFQLALQHLRVIIYEQRIVQTVVCGLFITFFILSASECQELESELKYIQQYQIKLVVVFLFTRNTKLIHTIYKYCMVCLLNIYMQACWHMLCMLQNLKHLYRVNERLHIVSGSYVAGCDKFVIAYMNLFFEKEGSSLSSCVCILNVMTLVVNVLVLQLQKQKQYQRLKGLSIDLSLSLIESQLRRQCELIGQVCDVFVFIIDLMGSIGRKELQQ
eukprot:TRINITY_DN1417_c1_g1_i4.p5 TRINITY_DN1417_c1_g1~~TRINITY_DN1417_c1_g1_i4.p5  ORF type:complete len:232 (-),score=0.63 TRINITY_DN1417_c1_g1_i4:89-784(-)